MYQEKARETTTITYTRAIDDHGRRREGDQFGVPKRTGDDIHADLEEGISCRTAREKSAHRVDSIIGHFHTGHAGVLNDVHGEFLRPFPVDRSETDGTDTDLSLVKTL